MTIVPPAPLDVNFMRAGRANITERPQLARMLYNASDQITGGIRVMDEQLAQRIVNDLAKHRSRNEIIRTICEETSLNWSEVEKTVQEVEQQHRRIIARRQSPLLIFLSLGSLLIGLLLIFYSIEFFIAFFQGEPLQQVLSLRSGYLRLGGALTPALA